MTVVCQLPRLLLRSLVALAPVLAAAPTGCATHVPAPVLAEKHYLEIDWAPDFERARGEAAARRRPLVAFLVAGELDGPC